MMIAHSRASEGEIELDESYFGGHRKSNRGRGAAGKIPVFGLLKRRTRFTHEGHPGCLKQNLAAHYNSITRKIRADSIVSTDCWQAYNAIGVTQFHHFRINHSELFADKQNHINGIENFWNQAERWLRKSNGLEKEHFPLFLKEGEFRFNFGSPAAQLNILKRWKLKHLI